MNLDPAEYPDPMPAVLVEWVDSQRFLDGWTHTDEARERAGDIAKLDCMSVGFLLHNGPVSIALVMTLGAGQATEGMRIPRCAIKRIRCLRGKIPRRK